MNANPLAMFEFQSTNPEALVTFYTAVFGWEVTRGSNNYAYIRFPPGRYHLLGGIGAAQPGVPGMGPGTVFYLQVDNLDDTLKAVGDNGGSTVMDPTTIDGYTFAMFKDPQDNIVGIIKPIATTDATGRT